MAAVHANSVLAEQDMQRCCEVFGSAATRMCLEATRRRPHAHLAPVAAGDPADASMAWLLAPLHAEATYTAEISRGGTQHMGMTAGVIVLKHHMGAAACRHHLQTGDAIPPTLHATNALVCH